MSEKPMTHLKEEHYANCADEDFTRSPTGFALSFVTQRMSTKVTQGNSQEGRDNVGVGNVNPMMIRERAAELAVMDGRPEDEVSEHDIAQAERELHADLTPDAPTGADPETNAETLVEQGIEEAVHDEILESNKDAVLGNSGE